LLLNVCPLHAEFTGFGIQTPTVAAGIVCDFVAKNDAPCSDTLRDAVVMTTTVRQGPRFGTALATFPKTQDVSGYMGFWWRFDGAGKVLAFENLKEEAAPKGTTDWKRCPAVPANSSGVSPAAHRVTIPSKPQYAQTYLLHRRVPVAPVRSGSEHSENH
jgi:hypothetical protein